MKDPLGLMEATKEGGGFEVRIAYEKVKAYLARISEIANKNGGGRAAKRMAVKQSGLEWKQYRTLLRNYATLSRLVQEEEKKNG